MPNPFIPRARVHAWSEAISASPEDHGTALPRLLRQQKRLARWVAENAGSMQPATAGIANYMISVVARLFDLAGGKLKAATWDQIRAAERRVMPLVGDLLPVDEGFAARARAVERAQPHILDEALMALFDTPPPEEEPAPDPHELLKVYLLMWVATEVLDANWTPPAGFEGEAEYTYVEIAPDPPEEAASAE